MEVVPKIKDRRQHSRVACHIPSSKEQNICNISQGGLYFETTEKYNLHQQVSIVISLPSENIQLKIISAVVRSVSVCQDRFGYGLKFNPVTGESSETVEYLILYLTRVKEGQDIPNVIILPDGIQNEGAMEPVKLAAESNGVATKKKEIFKVSSEFYADEADERFLLRASRLYGTSILIHYALVLWAGIPAWTMAIMLPVLMGRYMVVLHELIHVRNERMVDPFSRIWLVQAMVGPITVGYREFQDFHFRHHSYLLTEKDPDRYQIVCSHLVGFLHCVTSPEQNVVRWIAQKGLDGSLLIRVTIRAIIFSTLLWIGWWSNFLWFWIPCRLTFGAALFLFSHVLHHRGDQIGIFSFHHPLWRRVVMQLLFGNTGLMSISNHDVHHANAQIAPQHLEVLRPELHKYVTEAA